MSDDTLSKFLLLPELQLIQASSFGLQGYYSCVKEPKLEYCPRCATPSNRRHDSQTVTIKDAPLRGNGVLLRIKKRRLWCKPCGRPFTEHLPGIRPGKRTTERYLQAVTWRNFGMLGIG